MRRSIAAGLGVLVVAGAAIALPSTALAQEELDLYVENAWAIDQINADDAWATTKGEGVTVAVVDTGMSEHPFFDDKKVERGYSALDPSEEVDAYHDLSGHGTGVAAAVLYAAPQSTILPVRISTGQDVGFSTGASDVDFDGIRWAADNGADVIVLPWIEVLAGEDPRPSEEFLQAAQYAIDKDIVVIAGGGNDPELDQVPNPASFPGVIGVSGTSKDGASWSSSTTGPEIALAGPADTMTYPKPQELLSESELYFEAAGTSGSAGIVGGVVALVRAAHPELDASNVIQRLISTANDDGAGKTDELGYGLVDAEAAVNAGDVEAVTENPLGYPMGEAGASGASPDDAATSEGASEGQSPGAEAGPDEGAADQAGVGSMAIVLIAAAAVLLAGAVAVWLVLRSRSRAKPQVEPWQ